jgi:hypothetical protein
MAVERQRASGENLGGTCGVARCFGMRLKGAFR